MTKEAAPVIFLAFANEREDGVDYLRNLPAEARGLQAALDTARRANLCELVIRQGANTDDVLRVFQSDEYRNRIAIFHYGGHAHANGYQLLLDGGERLHGEGFAAFLGQQRGLQLVFLNGCATEGHVRHLLNAGIASVIATSRRIDDAVATEFSSRFYQALSSGTSLASAFAEAEGAVLTTRGNEPRGLYWGSEETDADRYPWALHVRAGAESVDDWSLPEAAGDPLFGLPALPELDLPEQPFRHLHGFAREHAWVFFGRGYQIRELYEPVITRSAPPLVLLYGQSGVGKSSLLDAGLCPRLEATHAVRYAKRDPALGLLGTLSRLLEAQGSLHTTWQTLEADEKPPLVAIIDQVEEAFTTPDPMTDEVSAFFDALEAIFAAPSARPRGKLVLGFRKEWLQDVEQRCRERQLPRAKVALERLDRRGIIEAVEGPTRDERLVQQYGLTVQDELADTIATDLLADPSAPIAPTLQILLTRMWEATAQDDKPEFNDTLYQTLKRDGLLLGDFLDRELAALHDWRRDFVDSGLSLDVLTHHTTSRGTSSQCTAVELTKVYRHRATEVLALVQRCRDRHLLVEPASKGKAAEPATRLAHDTLAPLVHERFEASDLPGQRARRILESRARDWADSKTGTVLDDADLALVEHGKPGMRDWTDDEARLVEASRNERDRRKRWRKIRTAVGLFAVFAIVLAGGIAGWQWQEAERQARISLSRALATAAQTLAESAPQRALLLAAEAVKRPLEADGVHLGGPETVLCDLLAATSGLPLRGSKSGVNTLAFDPQGHRLVITSTDSSARIWDLPDPKTEPRVLSKPESILNNHAIDPQGRWLATTDSLNEEVWLWDLAHPDTEARVLRGHQHRISTLAFDSQGRWLATGSDGTNLLLWDLTHPDAAARVLPGHEHGVADLAFDPQGHWLVTRSYGTNLRLWDLTHPDAKPHVLGAHGDSVWTLAFDSQGRWLVIKINNSTLHLWNLADPDVEPRVLVDEDTVKNEILWGGSFRHHVEFALDIQGRWLATATGSRVGNTNVRLWDLTDPKAEPHTLSVHEGFVRDFAFDPLGRWLATGSEDATVRLWDLAHPDAEPRVLRVQSPVLTLAYDPVGRWLATGSEDATVRLWDLAQLDAEPRVLHGHEGSVRTLVFDPQGRWLATTTDGSEAARLWDLAQFNAEPRVLRGYDGSVWTLAFDPQGRWLATRSGNISHSAANTNLKVQLWDLAQLNAEPRVLRGHGRSVESHAFDPQGRWLATGGEDTTVRLWDLDHPETKPRVLRVQSPVLTLAFDPRGRWLTTGSEDDTVRLWDLAHPETEPRTLSGHEGPVTDLAFDPLGRWLATGSEDTTVRLWDVAPPNPESRILRGHKGSVWTLAFDPQGRWLATGSEDTTVRLWDVAPPNPESRILRGHEGPVTDLAFDPQGRWLATGGEDTTVRLWDLAQLDAEPRVIRGHGRSVETPAFDLQGRWLATGGEDDTVRLWDLAHPETEPRTLSGHEGPVTDLAFDPLGRWLATGSEDGTVHLWQLDIEALLRLACRTAGRNLTKEEWAQHMGELEYRTTCPEFRIPGE